jgi:radical SAM superfamily enzyme YgiQ (UPF0313 family)
MKIVLINPNSTIVDKNWAYRRFCAPIAPMGIGYIAAVLEREGHTVRVFDQFAAKSPDTDVLAFIREENPSLIGIAALTTVVPDIKRLVSRIRAVKKNAVIVLGHIHATCFPEDVLREGIADIVVKGEGEMTMAELCRRLGNGKHLEDVPGISFRRNGDIIHNPVRPLLADLDSLPFPAWHLFDPDQYTEGPLVASRKTRLFPVLASRGCAYRCYYCSQDKVYEKVRFRDLRNVVDEMEHFFRRLNVRFFGVSDAYFPWDEESGMEFCDLLQRRGLHKKIRWCTETRVDKVSPRLLRAMKKAGAHLIMYGIEVGNETILRFLKKGTTLDQARAAIRETRKAGILSQGLFIIGLPGETEKTCRQTVDFAKELDCDLVKFNLAVPYPGSRFFEEHGKRSVLSNPERFTSWADWTHLGQDLVFTPRGMDSQMLRRLQRRAMLEYYIRPRVVVRNLLRGTISLQNLFLGGIWLLRMFFVRKLERIKKA